MSDEEEEPSEVVVKATADTGEEKIAIPVGERRKKRKERFQKRLIELLAKYKSILLINIDNVGSLQMAQVRIANRGRAVFLMGKNTLIRRIMKMQSDSDPRLNNLIPHIRGNVGLVFTDADLVEVRDAIVAHQVPAAAKTGAIAPVDVWVPPGPTGMDPGQTSFFQALNIATKIMRGCIEIIAKVHLVGVGEKVSASHVALLTKLGIKPFFYGIKVIKVYDDGDVYSSAVMTLAMISFWASFLILSGNLQQSRWILDIQILQHFLTTLLMQ